MWFLVGYLFLSEYKSIVVINWIIEYEDEWRGGYNMGSRMDGDEYRSLER